MHELLRAIPPQAHVGGIHPERLGDLAAQGVPLVDIRRAYEWEATGVIAGSHLITFFDEGGRYDLEGWLAKLAVLAGPDDPVILICRLAQRTDLLGRWLNGVGGYGAVMHLAGGIVAWRDGGHPVEPPENDSPR